ncbi:hypothetical protein RchiOBHm_Chr5g0050881 [Rosa chinensis]|uniref:Uncharacterized protein n=1 Tax=Rosa chinensis TaxID=74649 RepID=A0A2P6QF86_ROSCH|nr:hypothetical protein RchiOBHm_Chr5g0050881 [Rosa chinensis]
MMVFTMFYLMKRMRYLIWKKKWKKAMYMTSTHFIQKDIHQNTWSSIMRQWLISIKRQSSPELKTAFHQYLDIRSSSLSLIT